MRQKVVSLCLLTLACAAVRAKADVDGAVLIRHVAPPRAQAEKVPAPKAGFTWSPGFWDWRGSQYVWVAGEWIRTKPGYQWQAWRWVPQDDRWFFVRGQYVPVKGGDTPKTVVANR